MFSSLIEDLLERRSAVGRAVDAALRVRAVRMAEHRDEETVRVAGIDEDRADLPAVAQAEVLPRPPAVGRFVDAVADREVRPLQSLAAADVDDVRVRRRDRERADRLRRLLVEDRRPGAAGVVGLPDAAVVDADVEEVRACPRTPAAPTVRPPRNGPIIRQCIPATYGGGCGSSGLAEAKTETHRAARATDEARRILRFTESPRASAANIHPSRTARWDHRTTFEQAESSTCSCSARRLSRRLRSAKKSRRKRATSRP